jgi:hypothetical protein
MLASEMIVKLQGMILRYGNQPCTDSNGDELDDPEFVPADQDGPAVFVMAMES